MRAIAPTRRQEERRAEQEAYLACAQGLTASISTRNRFRRVTFPNPARAGARVHDARASILEVR